MIAKLRNQKTCQIAQNLNKLLILLIMGIAPNFSYAYVVYNKSQDPLHVIGSYGFDHYLPANNGKTPCAPNNSECYKDINLKVVNYVGFHTIVHCAKSDYIPAKETGHYYEIDVTNENPLQCQIKACRDGYGCQ